MQNNYRILLTNDMSGYCDLKNYLVKMNISVATAEANEQSIIMGIIENKPKVAAFNGTSIGADSIKRIVNIISEAEIHPVYFNMHFSDYTDEEIQNLLDIGVKFNIHAPCDSLEIAKFFMYLCQSKGFCPTKLQQDFLEFTRDTLNRIGVRTIYKGREYIVAMLYKILFESDKVPNIKNLYDYCAQQFHVSPESIRKAVDTAISVCYNGLTKEKIAQRFGKEQAEKTKISSIDFLFGVAKFIYEEFYFDFHKYHEMRRLSNKIK